MPSRLNKIDSSSSDLCWHGCEQVGTLTHMLWHCPAVKSFWTEVFHSVSLMMNIDFSPRSVVGLLGYRAAQLLLCSPVRTCSEILGSPV
uniref:Reverse transcriptase zinc-binding domain-containing protein n=1 Tax=Dicentrarchus labrax TaxID=13489 RepID=A0A8C4EM44_DICLA